MGGGSLAGSLWKKLSRGVERWTESSKSASDVEAAATRRALHRGAAGDKDVVGDE
jgi:hypothetical protein